MAEPNDPKDGDDDQSSSASVNSESVPLSADDLGRAFAQLMGEDDDDKFREENEADSVADSANESESPTTKVDSEDTAPVSPESILEAMLFVGHPHNVPLTSRLLASFMRGVSPTEIDEMIVELNEQYAEQQTAYTIVAEGDGYRLALRDELDHVRSQFYGRVKEAKLSQTAIDVLSIVAYNEPAERRAIEKTIGKPVGNVLGQLVRRNLLSLEKTTERPRKTIYRTTDRFLQFFGLDSIDDLPRGDDF